MEINNNNGKAKIIAYYLPQFYPCEFNNKWYGEGFTEWTNVGKAKPLFKGHQQPKVPSELGYYDLRLPEVAEKQAQLAKEAGVYGFCYWHYWFGNGRKLLDMPAERMLLTQKPDFPFCFGWANESWYKKLWQKDSKGDALIMEQTYPGERDIVDHFNYCLPFFKDKRYLTVNGRPLFMIYRPFQDFDIKSFINKWNEMIQESGIADRFCFFTMIYKDDDIDKAKEMGFDFVTFNHFSHLRNFIKASWGEYWKYRVREFLGGHANCAKLLDFRKVIKYCWTKAEDREDVLPNLIPNWDHSPRSGYRDDIIVNNNKENWGEMIDLVLSNIQKKNNKIVMLKSWNEWGEGNYMEPDIFNGKMYIEVLGSKMKRYE